MKTWIFKKYEKTKLKENRENIEMWFKKCKSIEDVKRLVAFLYSIDENNILDKEIKKLIEEINKNGLDLFLKQYFKYGKLGFTPNILIA